MHRVEIIVGSVIMSVNHLKLIIIQFSVNYLNIVYHSKFPQYLGINNVSNYLCFFINLKFKFFRDHLLLIIQLVFSVFTDILYKIRIN